MHVELPDQYPYKSPSIGFVNRIFHPNIDELYVGTCTYLGLLVVDLDRSGSVCLDVINQTWSPMFDMINIFEVFLPQLLRYPNPTDPLNGEAAAMLMRDQKTYDIKVKGMLPVKVGFTVPTEAKIVDKNMWQGTPAKKLRTTLAMAAMRRMR